MANRERGEVTLELGRDLLQLALDEAKTGGVFGWMCGGGVRPVIATPRLVCA